MQEFLRFYDQVKKGSWALEIYNSSIIDWRITIGFVSTNTKYGETIIDVQDCDIEYVFAKAQVLLKDWLSENDGGY